MTNDLQKACRNFFTSICLALATFWLLGLFAGQAFANYFGRPSTNGGPTEVKVSVYIIDMDEVDTAAQSFNANIYLRLSWRDPRLAHGGSDEIVRGLHEVWNPRIQILNQQKIWPTFPEIVEISPQGQVVYRQRFWGGFSQPLELVDFPFDKQAFQFIFVSVGYSPQEVELIPDIDARTGLSEKFSLADWSILDWQAGTFEIVPNVKREKVAGYHLTIEGQREYGYFIAKIIIPLCLIVMMSWVVFWIDPNESGTQISVAITAMLTLIAYRFAVGTYLPKVSYLTRLDYFILGATFLVFASLIEVVVTSTYAKIGNIDRARAIDRWARVLFPLVFVAVAIETLIFRFGL